jgi:phosphonate transport system substrate-binding protein
MDSPYPTYLIIRSGAAELFLRRWKGGAAEYRSIVFTKKDGGIARLEDLRGRIVAFEDIGSTSGYFLPKIFLQTRGLQLAEKPGLEAAVSADEVGYVFTHSTGKIVDLVLSKKAAAGAFSNEDYDRLDGKSRAALSVLAETENFPRNLVSIRSDLEPTLAYRLRKVLLSMHEDEEGRKILQKTDNTTKFDVLPGGEKAVRRRLADLFAPREKEKTEPAR